MLRCLVQGPREAPVLGRGRGRGRPWPPVDRAEPWEHPRACIFSTAPEAGTWWPGWGLGGGGRGSSSPGLGQDLGLLAWSASPIIPWLRSRVITVPFYR